MGAPKAQNAWFRVTRNEWDTLVKRGDCRYDFSPMQLCRPMQEKCGSVGGVFHCFQALMRAVGAQHVWFRVCWDVRYIILKRGGFRHDIWLLQYHFIFFMVLIIWGFFYVHIHDQKFANWQMVLWPQVALVGCFSFRFSGIMFLEGPVYHRGKKGVTCAA